MGNKRFACFAWLVFAINLVAVVLGGTVRATGSGAGCGNDWPLCQGQLLPLHGETATIIEFSHRTISALSLLLVITLYIAARRVFARESLARKSAFFALAFMIVESLLGASLVLFDLVGRNTSVTRALVGGVHVANSMFLMSCIALAAWYGAPETAQDQAKNRLRPSLLAGLFLLLSVAVTGAFAALGNTLFPSTSLKTGLAADFLQTSPLLIRLRFSHPSLAFVIGGYLFALVTFVFLKDSRRTVRRTASALLILVFVQLVTGLLNLFFLTPLHLQLLHLALAVLVWTSLVILVAAARVAPAAR